MTLSLAAMEWLEGRRLDVELIDRLGLLTSDGTGDREKLVYLIKREGQVVGRKFRPLHWEEGQPRFTREKGTPPLAFNEDCLRDESLVGQPLIITEGYEDCLAVIQAGYPKCLSVPDGAPEKPVEDLDNSDKYRWLDELLDAGLLKMDRVPVVILATDGDGPGAALMHDLSHKVGRSRCKFVTYPKAKDFTARGRDRLKDMNETLEDWTVRGVRAVIDKAAFLKVGGIYAMSEVPPSPDMVVYDLKDTGLEALNEHLRIRKGDVSAWTGVPSHGKSTALNDVICRIVWKYGIRAGFASFEQEPDRDHRRALRSWFCEDYAPALNHEQRWAADTWIDKHFRFIVPDEDEDADLDWLLDRMEAAVIQHGCDILVIDPWNEVIHEFGGSETDYTNRALRKIKRFAKKFQVHVMIVAHPAKMRRNDDGTYPVPSLYDISGSAAWYNKPDQGIVIHRLTQDETIFKIQKSRYHEILGKPGIVRMHYSTQTRRYIEIERNADEHPLDPDKPLRGARRRAA